MGVSKKWGSNNREMKKKTLEVQKVIIEVPEDRGINNFKNSRVMKVIMETKNMVVVYIIGVSRLMGNNK